MNTHADKTQENKSQSVSAVDSQMQSDGESTFQFVDNRPEAIFQRKLQEMANNSPQAKQAAQLQAMVNNSSEQQQPIQKKENNTGLPDNLKSGIENLSGYSLDDVKVHYNSDKPAQLQAHAYAQGTDIHVAPGQEKHLPHEAWHVVQQKQNRVKSTMQMKGNVNVNDDAGLEKEADVMGDKALNYADTGVQSHKTGKTTDFVVQRLRLKATPDTMIDFGALSLFRLLDYLSRANPDPDPGGVIFDPGDKAVMQHMVDGVYATEFQAIHTLLGQPAVVAEAPKRNIGGGVDLQQILTAAQTRFGAGNLPGFQEWVAGTHVNLNAHNVLDKMNELRAAAGIAGAVNVDESVIAGTAQTADLQHENEQTEVKTIRKPIVSHQNFTGQVSAALGKFAAVPAGGVNRYNVTIYASIDAGMLAGQANAAGPNNTRTTTIDPATLIKTTTITSNDNDAVLNTQPENQWNKFLITLNAGGWQGWNRAHQIDFVMENGTNRQFVRNPVTNVWT